MSVLLLQLDGKLPNLALMKLSHWYKKQGHEVTLRKAKNIQSVGPRLWDLKWDEVYASLIFTRTRPLAERLKSIYPDVELGGTGWDTSLSLTDIGITSTDIELDYSLYPDFEPSIGFTQRGCRLKCPFCVVPQKEGPVVENNTISQIWRGPGHPKQILLLDNDFFGGRSWKTRIKEIQDGGFQVNFTQGINARMLTQETAEAIATVDYRNSKFSRRCIYTAWDNRKDERRLFAGLNTLKAAGVKPRHIMVYMLIGFWPGETDEDWEYRRQQLRDFGADPYPMPYERNPKTVGFQRFVCGAYDKRVSWEDWKAADYQPRKLRAV